MAYSSTGIDGKRGKVRKKTNFLVNNEYYMLIINLLTKYHLFLGEDLLHFDVSMSMKVEDSGPTESQRGAKVNKKEVKLPLFSFASVAAATDNFSEANKLGEGGFGPVYKACPKTLLVSNTF